MTAFKNNRQSFSQFLSFIRQTNGKSLNHILMVEVLEQDINDTTELKRCDYVLTTQEAPVWGDHASHFEQVNLSRQRLLNSARSAV